MPKVSFFELYLVFQSQVSPSPCVFRSSRTELLTERPIPAGFLCKGCTAIVLTEAWSLGTKSSKNISLILSLPFQTLYFASIKVFFIVLYRLWTSWRHRTIIQLVLFPYCGKVFTENLLSKFTSFYTHTNMILYHLCHQVKHLYCRCFKTVIFNV